MSSFVLKVIAIISMLFDHIGYVVFDRFSLMNYIGRLAFPIFSFTISEGYAHTKDLKKYFSRLFIFAVISQVPYTLFLSNFSNIFTLNILFTLILGLLAITVYDKLENKSLGFIFVILIGTLAHFLPFDYGWFGVAIIFIFYLFKNKNSLMNLFFVLATFINYFYKYITASRIEYLAIIICCCLALIPINLYNGKKGKTMKYLFYIFYPLHLIVLYLLNFII